MPKSDDIKGYISKQISDSLKWSYRGQKLWSFATHGSTIVVVSFSAASAVLSQSNTSWHNVTSINSATILSIIVTVVSTIQSKLGFERKWIANRLTRSMLSQLEIDENMGADPEVLAKSLKDILAKHNQAITAG